jgi:hypothetical protein
MTTKRTLAQIADEIRARAETTEDIIAIGGLLREAQRRLPKAHSWLGWIEKELDFSVRTAENYMAAHRLASKFARVANVSETRLTATALYCLATAGLERNAIEKILRRAKTERVTRADILYLVKQDEKQKGRDEEIEAKLGDQKAVEDILAGEPPELPPAPEPTLQPLPPSDADDLLDDFKKAIDVIRRASAKPAERLRSIPIEDIRAAAAFLNYLVEIARPKEAA